MEIATQLPPPMPSTLKQCHQTLRKLWVRCDAQQKTIAELEEKLRTNSVNSSLPPSKDSIRTKAQRAKERVEARKNKLYQRKRIGAHFGHKGTGRKLLPIEYVNELVPCYAPAICACGGEIKKGKLRQRKQIFDLPKGGLRVTEYQIYAGKCEKCKKRYLGQLPEAIPKGILGANALSGIGVLIGKYRQSKREARDFLEDFFGLKISVGTISNAEKIINEALQKPVLEVEQAIQKAPAINVDETSHYQQWLLSWLWVLNSKNLVLFKISSKRNTESAKEFIGENYRGYAISDRYGAYNWLPMSQHQYCWAHLKRDLKRIAERDDCAESYIGTVLQSYLKSIFIYWRKIKTGTEVNINKKFLFGYIKMFRRKLKDGAQLNETKTGRFCARLLQEWRCLWHFLRNAEVEPTNNAAERALRHYVLWRKKSFGTQSYRGDLFTERILTMVMTLKQQNRNPLRWLKACLQAYFNNSDYPSLVGCSCQAS